MAGFVKVSQVISFEPNLDNYKSLKNNIKVNNFSKVNLINKGLSSKVGNLKLYGGDASGSVLSETHKSVPKTSQKVKIDVLDNYVKSVPAKSRVLLKIDVEGAEFDIFQGSLQFLEKRKVVAIFCEVVKHWGGGTNPNFAKTFELLKSLGYSTYAVGEKKVFQVSELKLLVGGGYLFTKQPLNKLLKSTSIHNQAN